MAIHCANRDKPVQWTSKAIGSVTWVRLKPLTSCVSQWWYNRVKKTKERCLPYLCICILTWKFNTCSSFVFLRHRLCQLLFFYSWSYFGIGRVSITRVYFCKQINSSYRILELTNLETILLYWYIFKFNIIFISFILFYLFRFILISPFWVVSGPFVSLDSNSFSPLCHTTQQCLNF